MLPELVEVIERGSVPVFGRSLVFEQILLFLVVESQDVDPSSPLTLVPLDGHEVSAVHLPSSSFGVSVFV